MGSARADEALARIEAATARIEAACKRLPPGGDNALAARHAALRKTVEASLADLDRLIGSLEG
ncbi:MAG TPA: hypothetical protein VLA37_13410 [Sphingomonadaceae bacterium]|nr:hypothetical protein [Sphingomonadaceae bacterium]